MPRITQIEQISIIVKYAKLPVHGGPLVGRLYLLVGVLVLEVRGDEVALDHLLAAEVAGGGGQEAEVLREAHLLEDALVTGPAN